MLNHFLLVMLLAPGSWVHLEKAVVPEPLLLPHLVDAVVHLVLEPVL